MAKRRIEELVGEVEAGELDVSDLPLHLEPLLKQVREVPSDDETIRELMNDLELVLYTETPKNQRREALKVLKRASHYVAKKSQS